MSVTVTSTAPSESLRAWYDESGVSDVAFYDIAAQGATTLASALIERQLATTDEREREYWPAWVRLVDQQRDAKLNTGVVLVRSDASWHAEEPLRQPDACRRSIAVTFWNPGV